jgi:predicted transcriptional regulator
MRVAPVRLSRLEQQVIEALWDLGPASVREIQEHFPEASRPAYTTVQTLVYRLEAKDAVRRAKKVGNALIFEAVVTRASTQRRLIDEVLGLSGGRAMPVMTHLIEAGKLTLEDVREAKRLLQALKQKAKRP